MVVGHFIMPNYFKFELNFQGFHGHINNSLVKFNRDNIKIILYLQFFLIYLIQVQSKNFNLQLIFDLQSGLCNLIFKQPKLD